VLPEVFVFFERQYGHWVLLVAYLRIKDTIPPNR
jgi:hypothetical protein